jgi:hypothetical protein
MWEERTGIVKTFVFDVKHWGWHTAFYNFRFLLGESILPGVHKHISVRDTNEACDHCE